ncbi:RNA exonuclease SCDLUD_000490 [Saccharomycodes ludwigii]|nr:hypothetical protein SCDLUD_000490 [Saccharomycodes ludwigii]KAH3902895.1 hypothetical protein SCDLUD_000490 [Saccharomycodes ludwigii]
MNRTNNANSISNTTDDNLLLFRPTFTFLSYNLLSPYYMWPQVYTYVPNQYKDWQYRHKLLEEELFYKYKADIMCLQELTLKDYDAFWKPTMSTKFNYGSNYINKPPPKYWEKTSQEMDGVGIFYNRDKFEFLTCHDIHLNDILGIFNYKEMEYLNNYQVTLTNAQGEAIGEKSLLKILVERNQVGLFVSLKHKESDTIFIVINTHLYWKYDPVKLTQCLILMRKLQQIIRYHLTVEAATYSQIKTIFAGDLNSELNSKVIQFLRGNIIGLENSNAKGGSGFTLVNPMRSYLNTCLYDMIPADAYINTCYSGKLKGIFDYIWFDKNDFGISKVLTGYGINEELNTNKQLGLPNGDHPSDHIPIWCEFEIKLPKQLQSTPKTKL